MARKGHPDREDSPKDADYFDRAEGLRKAHEDMLRGEVSDWDDVVRELRAKHGL